MIMTYTLLENNILQVHDGKSILNLVPMATPDEFGNPRWTHE